MRPLIPKVRVGSVLYGTKNLRNYLRKTSLLACLQSMQGGVKPDQAKKLIFTPQKDDEYVVAVNAWERFAVWAPRKDVVLIFINQDNSVTEKRRRLRPPPGLERLRSLDNTRMNSSIFPSWFINSNKRRIDLRQWPNYAYHLWASLHMNMISSAGGLRLVPTFPHIASSAAPFQYAGANSWERYDTRTKLAEGLKRGITRRRHAVQGRHELAVLGGRGIVLDELAVLDQEIKQIMDDPRFRKRVGNAIHVVADHVGLVI